MLECARFDDVHHPADHARRVFNAFAHAKMDFAGAEIERMTAELGHGDFKRHPRPRRWLLEDHAKRRALKKAGTCPGFIRLLEETNKIHYSQ